MRSRLLLAFAPLSGLPLMCALAQVGPQPPGPAAASTDLETRLAAAAEAYRNGPTRETVTIRVKDDRGRVGQSTITVAIDPGSPAGSPRLVHLDLGQLSVSVADRRVLAARRSDPTRYAEFTLPDEPLKPALEKLFPALALPQLVLADRTVPPTSDALGDFGLSPAGPGPVRWQGTRVDRGTGRVILEGDLPNGTINLSLDRTSHRLRSVELVFASGAISAIDVNARALEAGDPETWLIDTTARTSVDSLSDLSGDGEALRIGQPMPSTMVIYNTGGTRWEETSDRLASVLVLTRFDTQPLRERVDLDRRDETFRSLRRTVLPAIKLRDQLLIGAEDRYNARCVALIEDADLTITQAGLLFRLFDSEDNLTIPDPRNETVLLAESTADFDPIVAGGLAAAVILDTKRIVRGIVTLDEPNAAEQRVRAILDALPQPEPRPEFRLEPAQDPRPEAKPPPQ